MNKPLLLKLWLLLALGTVALFWAIALLLDNTERELSMLSEASRQQLLELLEYDLLRQLHYHDSTRNLLYCLFGLHNK